MTLGSRQANESQSAFSLSFYLLVVATGVGAGLSGGLLMLLLGAVQHWSWPYRVGDDFLAAAQNAKPLRVVLTVTSAGVLVGTIRLLMREKSLAGRDHDLKEQIWFHADEMRPFRTVFQAIFSVVIVGMGASLGRELAPKQVGALIASLFARATSLPISQRRILIACGAGAGIAAVYNVPFGGALFSLEVLMGAISLSLAPPALLASGVATAVSWLLLPDEATYVVPFYPVTVDQIVWAVVVGPVAGLVSVAYVRLISWTCSLQIRGVTALLAPPIVFCALGGLAVYFPQLLGNGKGVVQRVFLGEYGAALLAILVLAKPILTAACIGSGAPGGLFTPTLTLGALFGALLGHGWLCFWPGSPLGGFAIVGACAVLAAATRGPISGIVLVLELTRRLDTLIVPVVIATVGAIFVAGLLDDRSIYSARMQSRLSAEPGASWVDEAGRIIVSAGARYEELLRASLWSLNAARPAPLVDLNGKLIGAISVNSVLTPPVEMVLEACTAMDFVTPAGHFEDSAMCDSERQAKSSDPHSGSRLSQGDDAA